MFSRFKKIEGSISSGLESVREELNIHLDSINGNTSEIQSIFDYLAEIEAKIDKVSERMDKLDMLINPCSEALSCDIKLNKREQEVFVALYTADKELTAKDVAKRLGFSDEMVVNYLYNLIAKGIPIVKEVSEGDIYLKLNKKFKELQAKKNVLNIEESVIKFAQI